MPYSSTPGASRVGHTVSQEEHQPPVPCPQCVVPRLKASSLEPRESGSLKIRLCLSPMMSLFSCLLGLLCGPLGSWSRGWDGTVPYCSWMPWGEGGAIIPPVSGSIRFPKFLSIRTVSGALSTTGQRRKEQARCSGLRGHTSEPRDLCCVTTFNPSAMSPIS